MTARAFALLLGVVFGLLGVGSLVPGLAHPIPADAPPLMVSDAYGLVLGLFPVNIIDTLLYLVFGILGVAAWDGLISSETFARLTAVCFTVMTIMGLTYPENIAFGLVPLYGADVPLHAVVAVSAWVYGLVPYRRPVVQA
jgi:hypothetical protein